MNKMKVGTKIYLGFGTIVFFLSLLGIVTYFGLNSMIDNARWVNHTREVLEEIQKISSFLKDAETGQRGFLITGQDRYLEPYNNALKDIEKSLDRLKSLTSDNPTQQERIEKVKVQINLKLEELLETITLRRTKGFDAALAVVLTDKGKKVMDEIRSILDQMKNTETALEKRDKENLETTNWNKMTIFISLGLGIVAAIWIGFAIGRGISRSLNSAVEIAASVSSAAQQVSATSMSLSEGASEQAASLEQITASIEEMSSSVTQNSDSALETNKIASASSKDAIRGQESVL
jgi:CHASE3 domain sensor protein